MAVTPQNDEYISSFTRLPGEAEAQGALMLLLRRRGVSDRNVLAALEQVPRRLFLPARYQTYAYDDLSLPIECGQSILEPSTVALTMQSLNITKEHNVLEIGTGSGYQSAILSFLAGKVETLDRFATLVDLAKRRFAALKLNNVEVFRLDGFKGLEGKAPFDRIVVNAAVEAFPQEWIDQLKPGGILVCPVGKKNRVHDLNRFQKGSETFTTDTLMRVRTVMLQKGLAEKL